MSSFAGFLEMGGYGGYVWPAYALTAAVLLALLFESLRRLRSGARALAKLEALSPPRQRRGGPQRGSDSNPERDTERHSGREPRGRA